MDRDKHKTPHHIGTTPLIGYQILIFLAQIFILVACIEFTQVLYNNDILPDKLVKETYPQTSCQIISKNLSEKGKLVQRYRADFLVSYSVNGQNYQTMVTGNGLDQAFFHERQPQEDVLAQYEVGTTYPCWYNPQIPQIVVLVLRHNWASTLPLAVPTIIGLIAFFYIIRSILSFFGLLGSKTREMMDKNRHYKK